MKTIVVGNNQIDYNSRRNFMSLPYDRVRFKKTYDLFKLPNHLARRLLGRSHPMLQWLYCDGGLNRVDLLHLFNSVSASRKPWVVTFETSVPRWNPHSRWGMGLLAGPRCKKLIAMSQTAFDIQCAFLERMPEYHDPILSKMMVLHPPQPLEIQNMAEKPLACQGDLIFTLVGQAFFRKGGAETLWAFDRLLDEGLPVRLNMVSRIAAGDYTSGATDQDVAAARAIIARHPQRIVHHERLDHTEVIALFKASHVGLLPSYDETYGYSVLEAQACGCPVITTAIRALAEANRPECGYLISVPTGPFRFALRHTPQQRRIFSQLLRQGLYETIKHLCHNPGEIGLKGAAALEKIRTRHDPRQHAMTLQGIYQQALDGLTAS